MKKPVLILYGTVTGNAEICATKIAARLEAEGLQSAVKDIFDVSPERLREEDVVLLCVSTYGDGDPPDPAAPMWETLVQNAKLNLSGVRFSVLALGDSSYPRFCQCGKDFDSAFEKLGAQRLAPRVDCDVDYESACNEWIEKVALYFQRMPPSQQKSHYATF